MEMEAKEELHDATGEREKLWDGFEDREESEVETEDLNCLLDSTDPPAQTHLSGCKRFACTISLSQEPHYCKFTTDKQKDKQHSEAFTSWEVGRSFGH